MAQSLNGGFRYLHEHWEPMYHADVARDMSAAQLEYVCSTHLLSRSIELEPQQQAIVDSVADPAWRETMMDCMLNTGFRSDLYVRGKKLLSPATRNRLIRSFHVALLDAAAAAELHELDRAPALAGFIRQLVGRLQGGPVALGELLDESAVGDPEHTLVALDILHSKRCVGIFRPADACHNGSSARRLNQVIARKASQGQAFQALASPATGSGIAVDMGQLDRFRRRIAGGPDGPLDDIRDGTQPWAGLGL